MVQQPTHIILGLAIRLNILEPDENDRFITENT